MHFSLEHRTNGIWSNPWTYVIFVVILAVVVDVFYAYTGMEGVYIVLAVTAVLIVGMIIRSNAHEVQDDFDVVEEGIKINDDVYDWKRMTSFRVKGHHEDGSSTILIFSGFRRILILKVSEDRTPALARLLEEHGVKRRG